MTLSPLDSILYGPLFSYPPVAKFFSDKRQIESLVEVEVALASAQSRLGLIPASAAQRITQAAVGYKPDMELLREGVARDGFPVVALLGQLRAHVGGEAAEYLHWGATTQDIMDTALVLRLRDALDVMDTSLLLVIELLAQKAATHRTTLMAGRTHSQQALPITFALKAASWLSPLLRHRERLRELRPRLLVVQLGGASGTLASLGMTGTSVQKEFAAQLHLGVPLTPWHTQRDTLVELASWLSLVSGTLAKMAQDVILLAQSEIAEVRESDDPSRGGSSTMPQKSNPIVSELIVAAARANTALLSGMHQAVIQEHERATHGWQLEWLTLPQMMALTAGALEKGIFLTQHLVVDEEQMQDNINASRGLMLAEMLTFALAEHMNRSDAKALVTAAVRIAIQQDRHLTQAVKELAGDVPIDWDCISEHQYTGASDELVDQVLHRVQGEVTRDHPRQRP